MDSRTASQGLLQFICESPCAFFTVKALRARLDKAGFAYLPEGTSWTQAKGGKYYTVRNDSSLIAWKAGETLDAPHFQLVAAHNDSPTFKLKNVPELSGPESCLRLDVEAYGGMIDYTWFDRPLTLAGRVYVREGRGAKEHLVYFDRDLLLIPSLAVHMDRDMNKSFGPNRQVDLLPLWSAGKLKQGSLDDLLAEELSCKAEDILGRDLYLVNREKPTIWGAADEFVSAGHLDDLQSVYAGLEAFLSSENPHDVSVLACFDNEEVGSNTKQGAMSTLLRDTLSRIASGLGWSAEELHEAYAKSFLVSADNAHAVHPNHPEKSDEVNRCQLNHGIVIKEAANQLYTSDAFSRSVLSAILDEAKIPYQTFANRSDMRGGSTLGNLSNTQVSLHAVDVGMPQLAMHSAYETTGIEDTALGIAAMKAFFEANLEIEEAESFRF